MYKIGDCVVHRSAGVCQITGIVKEDFGFGLNDYYVLESYFNRGVSNSNQTMVMVDNPRQIRDFATKEKINEVLESIDKFESLWINDSKHRKEIFMKILSEGDLIKLCQLIKTVYMKKNEYSELKKNVPITDNTICASAEKLVYEEFAISLGMKPSDAETYLNDKLKN